MLPPNVEQKLEQAAERQAELEARLADPEVTRQPALYQKLSRECGEVAKLVALYKEYGRAERELQESEEIAASETDEELAALAREEAEQLRGKTEELAETLVDRVLVQDEHGGRNVILEIRAGTGGEEAALFTADLYRMYTKYAERRGWKIEALDASPTSLGGYKEIILSVTGENVFRDLRYESGGHRVQRVPATEGSGRIHTSAATVAVLGEPEDVELDLRDSDLRIDFYRAGGPGGQKVNKTSSAVRITHVPTGLVVAIQDETSQHKNRAKALRVLRSRLFERLESERQEAERSERRGQIGSGDRSQRVRTYNFPQNRVTDHRLSRNFPLERVLQEGELDPVIEALRAREREARLQELES